MFEGIHSANATNRRLAVVILGMHRSGTSLVTASLQALGVELGDHLMAADEFNPKGYFEDMDVYTFNEEMLRTLNRRWDTLGIGEENDLDPDFVETFLIKTSEVLECKFAAASIIGFKDPRLSRLLPIWQRTFKRLDIDNRYVIAVRHPLSVADSLAKRDGIDRRKSLLLWFEYIVLAVHYTTGKQRAIVDYDQFIEDPERVLTNLSDKLGLPLQKDSENFSNFKREIFDPALRHTQYHLVDLERCSEVSSAVLAAYQLLRDTAIGEVDLESPEFDKEWAAIEQAFRDQISALTLLGKLDHEITNAHQALQEELRTSFSLRAELKKQNQELEILLEERDQLRGEQDQLRRERDALLEASQWRFMIRKKIRSAGEKIRSTNWLRIF